MQHRQSYTCSISSAQTLRQKHLPTQIHAPTGVTIALAGAFTSPATADGAQPDLVLARSTRLELWHPRCGRMWGVTVSTSGCNQSLSHQLPPLFIAGVPHAMARIRRPFGSGGVRLEAGATERLWGVIESMAVLRSRREGRGRDALLLTFRCEAPDSAVAFHEATTGLAALVTAL